jgi:hypothetical protein
MCESLCSKKNAYEYYLDYRLTDCLNEKSRVSDQEEKGGDKIFNMYDEYKVVLIYERTVSSNEPDPAKPKRIVLKSRRKFFLSYDVYMDFDFREKPIYEQLKFLANHFKVGINRSKPMYNVFAFLSVSILI